MRGVTIVERFLKEGGSMFIVAINQEKCTGCDSCAEGCPAHILGFDGTHAYVSGDEAECLGCESCTSVCPSGAVTITEL
ncbi:indolepyruvate ferredoxin oxidoreductase subunit alpha [Gordonibacter sp.]|uniref:indolepyruvate ferredoxin oxidoreductase subunit alpha n=2 Tax=Gordonibacter sp. TaxID=1968902 RepID=UPI002FC9E0EE